MFRQVRKLSLAAVAAVLCFNAAAHAESRVQGAGATFPAPLYKKWVETFNQANPEIKVDYQAIGSGGGIKAISDRTVQFGASDAPLTDAQLEKAPGKLLHIPTVAGPAVMTYNLPGLDGKLKLDGLTIAGIYLGNITKWNADEIAKTNPGVKLPDTDIIVVHRSDGSGTSWIFTNYLSNVSSDWASKIKFGTSVKWPVGLGGKGNDGVTAAVKNTEGGIGYVELAYAKSNNLPYATLINKDGKEVDASIESVKAAGSHVDIGALKPGDLRITTMTNAAGADSYPICGFTYLLIYQDMSYTNDKQQAQDILKYVNWCVTDGQQMAAGLNYAQLPEDLQKKVQEELKSVTFNGESLLK